MNNSKVDQQTEVKAVALLARGDSPVKIAEELGIHVNTVRNIKERNVDVLADVKHELVVHEIKKAKTLLDKSHSLIEKRLSAETKVAEGRQELSEMLANGDIEYRDYIAGLKQLPQLTLAELTALSKEMFNQSQIEEGKPTSIPGGAGSTSPDAVAKLQEILDLLNADDTDELLEYISID